MYPRNAASPDRVDIGPVIQISDGAVQTAGVAVKVIPFGGTEAAGAGTVAYSADGVVLYTPTQSETNYTSFILIASKAGCFPASKTVVTSASATAGYAGVDWSKVTAATTTVNLSGTTISTSQAVASVTGAVGSVTTRVTANTDQWGGMAVTGMPMPTYPQPAGFLAATFPATVSSFAGGAVASVTGSVGSVTSPVTVGTNNDKTGYSLTAGTGLGNQTADITGSVTSVVNRVTANTDQWGGVAVTGMPMPTYTQPTGFLAAVFPATVSSFAGGAVASVTGAVGSVTSPVTVGTNNDKTGYSLTQAFPTNFAALGINASGHVSRVTLVDTTTTNTDMRGTDNAALASAWTSTRAGYLDSVLLAATSNRTVLVTGSNHVAADIHDLQPAVITSAAFAAGAVDANAMNVNGAEFTAIPWNSAWDSEVQSEVQDAIEANHLDHLLAVAYDPASKPGAATALFNALAQNNGAGVPQFTQIALELAPAGGGGGTTDWTASERTAIRSILGIPTSGTTPLDPSVGILDTIRDRVADVEADTQNIQTRLPAALVSGRIDAAVGVNNDKTGYSLTAGTGLGNQTANITGSLSGSVGSVTGAVGSVTNRVTANVDQWGGVAVTGMPMPTYTQPTGFLAAVFPSVVSSYAGGPVASVTGSVGSVTNPVTVGANNDKTGYSLTPATGLGNQTANITGSLSGSVGSVTGAVGSVTNRVTANTDQWGGVAVTGMPLPTASYTAPLTAAGTRAALGMAAANLDSQFSATASATALLQVLDRVSFCLASIAGNCSTAQTATETYVLSIGGNTYTAAYSGLDGSGNRGTTTLSKV